jgi:hypothetical protein
VPRTGGENQRSRSIPPETSSTHVSDAASGPNDGQCEQRVSEEEDEKFTRSAFGRLTTP